MIAVPITERTTTTALAAAANALVRADLVEFRLDLMDDFDLPGLLAAHRDRAIITARPARQGGQWPGSERARVSVLRDAIRLGAAYVDVELDSIHEFAAKGASTLIVSYHDFMRTPDDLPAILMRMVSVGAHVAKFACLVQDQSDNLKLLSLLERKPIPVIAVGLGERGLPSRILGAKLGGFLTFASLDSASESAPGQPTLTELLDLYACRSITPSTAFYGVIGKPVAHSASPAIMNRAFRACGLDAVYLPFLVDDPCAFVRAFDKLDVRGYSVTIPHKESVMALLDEVDPLAAKVGAVNTLYRRDGKWLGANT
ncbi:MAG: type I 3-dehydroquinate dehydratase, partial [Planctomycetota bacterium]